MIYEIIKNRWKLVVSIIVAIIILSVGIVMKNQTLATNVCSSCGTELTYRPPAIANVTHRVICENCEETNYTERHTWEGIQIANNNGVYNLKCQLCEYIQECPANNCNSTSFYYDPNGTVSVHPIVCYECNIVVGTESHEGGKHSTGGECTKCGGTYQEHGKSSEIVGYTNISSTKHKVMYRCTYLPCTEKISGEEENHNYQNGVCVCGATEEVAEEHIHNWQPATCTKPATCTGIDCGATKGSKLGHNYVQTICSVPGECTRCSAQDIAGMKNHVLEKTNKYTVGSNPSLSYHYVVAKCTNTEFGCTYETTITEPHEWGDGTCTSPRRCEQCGYSNTNDVVTGHSIIYSNNENGTHTGICKNCDDYEVTASHTYSTSGTCSKCGAAEKVAAHSHHGGDHENGGQCQEKGCGVIYQTHEEILDYEIVDLSNHRPMHVCLYCDYVKYETTLLSHTYYTVNPTCRDNGDGETHQVRCKDCLSYAKSVEHTYSEATCKKLATCKCGATTGTYADHKGGNHEKGGKCSVCGTVYQEHEQWEDYEANETTHTVLTLCTCGYESKGATANHTYYTVNPTCKDNGDGTHKVRCKECLKYGKSEAHTYSAATCTTPATCTAMGCKATTGTATPHTGGTHAEGKCSVCKTVYQNHFQSQEILRYDTTGTTHTPIYKCTESSCSSTYTGTVASHEITIYTDNGNGTHSGACTKCSYVETASHNYQNGKCAQCGVAEPAKECSHTYEKKHNETQHWDECSKCDEVKQNSIQNHTIAYTDKGDGTHSSTCATCNYTKTASHNYEDGKCAQCGVAEPVTECSHTYVKKYSETEHWEQCGKCNEIKSGSKVKHTITYKDNGNGTHTGTCSGCSYKDEGTHSYSGGKCEKCSATQSTTNCEHEYKTKSDSTTHWEQCEKCNEIKSGTKENHSIVTYTSNGDGTHTGTCTVCDYESKGTCAGTDGKCSKCGATISADDNDDTDNDDDNNTDNDHNNGGNTNNSGNSNTNNGSSSTNNGSSSTNNGSSSTNKGDSTTSDSKLPQTGLGSGTIIVAIVACASVSLLMLVKVNKYKFIK